MIAILAAVPGAGVSKVALVGPEIEENLSLRYLAAALGRAGHAVELVPFNQPAEFGGVLTRLVEMDPEVVGLSLAFQWRAQDFLALAVALRAAGWTGHLSAGGHFGTFAAAEILGEFPELDSVLRQEAEETLVALVEALAAGRPWQGLPGVAHRDEAGAVVLGADPPLPDLAGLAPPDRRGEPATCLGHAIAPLVASRGCYANCSFCCIAAWHEQSLPGRRYRLREVDAVADEMAALQAERGIDTFVFHDDNFFQPRKADNLARFHALADALEARGVRRFATVVKARPTDVDREVFRVLKERLRCIRVYVGIETDADRGLRTLQRWAHSRHNHAAMEVIRELDLYACFNLLLFDPDTTLADLRTNLRFMREAADFPFNFGRVELYAGTPLLRRMQLEGRVTGDWLQWDYALSSPAVERVFAIAMKAFHPRNFGDGALANHLMGTRFDVEVARHFHPERTNPAWVVSGRALSRRLGRDSADALSAIVDHVEARAGGDLAFAAALGRRLRAVEDEVRAEARALARSLALAVGGRPLTDLGDHDGPADPVATSLQSGRSLVAGETFLPPSAP